MAICIAGMHHSGAPMTARALHLMGLHVDDEADGTRGEDRDGEDVPFVELNDKILHELGGAWDVPVGLPAGWKDQDRFVDLRERGGALVASFADDEPWGWSDPRTSLTLGFWQELVPDLKVVVCLRHPLEVALLLQARARMSWSDSIALWRAYNERLLEAAPPGRRAVTSYDQYFSDPASELRRLSAVLGLEPRAEDVERAVESINPARRPSRFAIPDLADVSVDGDVLDLYRYLLDQATQGAGRPGPSTVPAEVDVTTAREDTEPVLPAAPAADGDVPVPAASAVQELLARQDEMLSLTRELRDQIDRRGNELQGTLYDLHAVETGLRPPPAKFGAEREYLRGADRLRQLVHAEVPQDATALVVSRGDAQLLKLYGRRAWHFPRDADGGYTGYHPSNSAAAIFHLETMRALGADHLILPASELWWLDHYAEFRAHLEARFRLLHRDDGVAWIYSLTERPRGALVVEREVVERLTSEFRMLFDRDPVILDWESGRDLSEMVDELRVLVSPAESGRLPHPDSDVDIVVLAHADDSRLAEAHRVASAAVVEFHDLDASGGPEPGAPEIAWLDSAAASLPSVSIVVPCVGGVERARVCLGALRWTLPQAAWCEVIAVDDASTDGTDRYLAQLAAADPRVRGVRNAERLGSVASVNQGARIATGTILVVVDPDTILLPGWLPPLLRAVRAHSDVGVVGGKLLHLDGSVREAGGIVFADGSTAGFGDLDPDPSAPAYNVARDVDFCSSAALATPRALFEEMGGLNVGYAAGSHVDADYCFRVRALGYRTVYQPETATVRLAVSSAEEHDEALHDRGRARNQDLFVSRWRHELDARPSSPDQVGR